MHLTEMQSIMWLRQITTNIHNRDHLVGYSHHERTYIISGVQNEFLSSKALILTR